jgi:hypothetical protein
MSKTKQEVIIEAVCQHFGLSKLDLETRKDHNTAYIRDICFYLIKKETYLSDEQIGQELKRGRCVARLGGIKSENLISIKDRRILGDLNKINMLLGTFTQ